MNPAAPFVANISSGFTGSPSASISAVQLVLNNSVTGTGVVFDYPSSSTTLKIPANTLLPDTEYSLHVGFFNVFTAVSSGVPTSLQFVNYTNSSFTTGNATPVQVLSGLQGGPASNPVALSGTGIAALSGTIGGFGSADFYRFSWPGGEFTADASVTGVNADGSYDFELFNANGGLVADEVLDAADDFAAAIDESISAADYIVGLVADNINDPSFTITFDTPVEGAAVATPEPDTLSLVTVGLGLLLLISFLSPSDKRA
jgi:hypothetical protein